MRFFCFASALLFLATPVMSEPIAGSSFGFDAWSGEAYYNNETGKWSHCVVSAEYPNGYNLSFSLTSGYALGLFLYHRSTPVFLNSGKFEVVTKVDNFAPMFGTVNPLDEYAAGIWFDDLDKAIIQFKKGNTLTVSSRLGTESFGLRGTYKALDAAYACARKYQDFKIDNYNLREVEQDSTAWNPSAADTSAMYQLATLLITDFNLKDFRYSPPNEQIVPGSVQFLANSETLLGIIAVGRYVGEDLDLTQLMASDIGNLTSNYCGDGDMAIVNSTSEIEGVVTKSLKGLCNRKDDPFTAYATKQVISGRLVETIILNYDDTAIAGSYSDTPTENVSIIAAKLIK